MTKEALIELAVGCGWTHGCQELVRGYWVIQLPFGETGVIKLEGPKPECPITADLSDLQQAYPPWQHLIGPFKEGWFSLKANRFCQ